MTKTEENINPLKGIYGDLMGIVKNMVVKYNCKAEECETFESKAAADAYFDAYYKRDTYFTYSDYDIKDCTFAGIQSSAIINLVLSSPKDVPRMYQEGLLNSKRERIIEAFEESNNYYRMLIGLPDTDDTDFICPEEFADVLSSYGIDASIPLHLIESYYNEQEEGLGDYYIQVLEGLGIIDEYISLYPDKEYLKFLGSNRIDLFTARNAKNFEIIRLTQSKDTKSIVYDTFITQYSQARDYFMSVIYIVQNRAFIPYYDNFIAMCICIMAINQVVTRQMQLGIRREFYDDYAIKLLYQAYDIPYNLNIDNEIQRGIMQNLNLLIQDKATNKVMYDIVSLLGYSNFNVYKYFLVKQRLYDAYGLPLTLWTEKFNTSTGEYETVLDTDKMYDIYFQKVDLKETDIMNAFGDQSNRVDYDSITGPDPLWFEDTNLHDELYNDAFNFVESKYLGLGVSYSMTDIIFENILLIKMLMKKKDEISTITLDLPRIISDIEVPLYDAIILLICLTAKKHHLKGEIITVPTQVIAVLDYLRNRDNGTSQNIDGDLVSSVKAFLEDKKNDMYMADTFSFNFDNFIANMDIEPPTIKYVTDQGRYYIENSDGTYSYYTKDGSIIRSSVPKDTVDQLYSDGLLTIDIVDEGDPVTKFYTDWGGYFVWDDDHNYWIYYDENDNIISSNYVDHDILLGSISVSDAEEILKSDDITFDASTGRYYDASGNYYCLDVEVLIKGKTETIYGYYYPHDVEWMQLNGLLSKKVELKGMTNVMTNLRPLIRCLDIEEARELLKCLSVLSINSNATNSMKIAAINSMYQNIKHLNTYIHYLMAKTQDKETYEALKTFYRATFFSREMREVFYINNDAHNGWLYYTSDDKLIREYSTDDDKFTINYTDGTSTTYSVNIEKAISVNFFNKKIVGDEIRYYVKKDEGSYFVYKGRPAKTYFEYLHYYNPKLYNAVFIFDINTQYNQYLAENGLTSSDLSLSEFDALICLGKVDADYSTLANESESDDVNQTTLYNYINHILTRLENIIDGLSMMHLINESTTPLEDLLIKLIKFFKSYTVDLVSIDTILVCDIPSLNMMKLIDEVDKVFKVIQPEDKLYISYGDLVDRILARIKLRDGFKLSDNETHNKSIYPKDLIDMIDELIGHTKMVSCDDDMKISYGDSANSVSSQVGINEHMKLSDKFRMKYE